LSLPNPQLPSVPLPRFPSHSLHFLPRLKLKPPLPPQPFLGAFYSSLSLISDPPPPPFYCAPPRAPDRCSPSPAPRHRNFSEYPLPQRVSSPPGPHKDIPLSVLLLLASDDPQTSRQLRLSSVCACLSYGHEKTVPPQFCFGVLLRDYLFLCCQSLFVSCFLCGFPPLSSSHQFFRLPPPFLVVVWFLGFFLV